MKNQPHGTAHREATPSRFSLSDIGIEDTDLRLEIFVLCDGATEHDGRLSLLGTYDVIQAVGFPFVLPQVTVVLRVRFWPQESGRHAFRLVLTSPDGEPVGLPMEVMAALQPASGERSSAYNLITQLQSVRIDGPGEYTFDFYLDDKIEGRLPICVRSAASLS